MKRLFRFVPAALAALFFVFVPALADFTDDCAAAQSDGWHMYQNLAPTPAGPAADFAWSAAPDRTALAIVSPQAGPAAALYAVNGARGIEVSMYSVYSTFSTRRDGQPVLGSPFGGGSARAKRLLYAESSGRVYLNDGGWWALECDAYGDFVFTPLSSAPTGALSPYGLEIACSPDGVSFSTVPVALGPTRRSTEDGADHPCYYETYSASVPSGTRQIRVILREMNAFPLVGGGTVTNATRGPMRLASVTFTGDAARGSLSGEPSSAPAPSSGSPSESASESSTVRDPDLQTSSAPSGGHTDAGGAGENQDSRASRASSSSRRTSSASSRASSRAASSRASTKGASVFAEPSSSADAPEETVPPEQSEQSPREERAAAPREADTRTLLLGGGYLVFAGVLLAAIARKK